MRLGAVGDIHGRESLAAFRDALAAVPDLDVLLLAGDVTDHNRIEEFGEVVDAVKGHTSAPLLGVFGNNEWSNDHTAYRERFAVEFLDDEAKVVEARGKTVRIIGSTGALDEPTWWQRNNLPGIEREYEMRVRKLDQLLGGDDVRLLLTHYPPTHATMGAEKESWRPQLGSLRLEKVVLRRRPEVVVHGHVHKGVPFAELRGGAPSIESFAEERRAIPVYNVAFPVTHRVTILNL